MFFVINEDAETSCDPWDTDDEPRHEVFGAQIEAVERAQEVARLNPGQTFYVVQTIFEVECPVGDPVVTEFEV